MFARRLSCLPRAQGVRFAHQAANPANSDLDPDLVTLIKSYPKHANPTPYELLDVSYHSFDERTLKSNFNKFAKLYHPDIKFEHHLLVDKHEKFHKILSAYKLLKNPRSKKLYDELNLGWDSPRVGNYTSFSASPNFKEYQYYSAGTWEDFQHMKNGSPSHTMDLEKNKYQIAFGVVAVMVIVGIIEAIGLQDYSVQESSARAQLTKKSNQDLQKAYDNYGMGVDKNARINRFLWWRQISDIVFNHS